MFNFKSYNEQVKKLKKKHPDFDSSSVAHADNDDEDIYYFMIPRDDETDDGDERVFEVIRVPKGGKK